MINGLGNIRESMGTSWTVVMGPTSGTLTFRLRAMLCWVIRTLSPDIGDGLSFLSEVGDVFKALAFSASIALLLFSAGSCLSLGKS